MSIYDRTDRWLLAYEYNMVRVIEKLAEIVEKMNGSVERHDEELLIHNRGYQHQILDLEDKIQRTRSAYENCTNPEENSKLQESRRKAIASMTEKLEEYRRLESEAPVIKTQFFGKYGGVWINFSYDGYDYYFGVDDNPFFPDSAMRKRASAVGKYYMDSIECQDKKWLTDDILRASCADESIESSAKALFLALVSMPEAERYA